MKDFYLKHNPGKIPSSRSDHRTTFYASFQILYCFNISGETEQPFSVPLLAGMAARVFSVSLVSPLELIRTKMQSQKLSYYGMRL